MNYKVKQIVRVVPEEWRKKRSFIGKIRNITQSGAYVSCLKGKKNAEITSVYYGFDEIRELKGAEEIKA